MFLKGGIQMTIFLTGLVILLFISLCIEKALLAKEVVLEEAVSYVGENSHCFLNDKVVYISHASKKYHRQGCHFILDEEMPINVDEARKLGFSSCKVCKPE